MTFSRCSVVASLLLLCSTAACTHDTGTEATDESELGTTKKLSANDISVLFPVPGGRLRESPDEPGASENLLSLDAKLDDGRPLLPPEVFRAVFDVATKTTDLGALRPESLGKAAVGGADFAQGPGPRIIAPNQNPTSWKVVAFRFDPCFPFEDPATNCQTQIRLIVSPLNDREATLDTAMHLVYDFPPSEAAPLARALAALKTDTSTNGQPLGVHPVMAKEGLRGKTAASFRAFLTSKLVGARLTTWAFMGLSGRERPWVFLGGVVRDGKLFVAGQELAGGLSPSISMDVGGRNLLSEPTPAHPVVPSPPPGHANTLGMLNLRNDANEDAVSDAMRLLNPRATALLPQAQHDPRHTDCVSCHTASAFVTIRSTGDGERSERFRARMAASPSRFVAPADSSAEVAASAVADGNWNVHNFGYSNSGRPSVSIRAANETALAVRFANTLLAKP